MLTPACPLVSCFRWQFSTHPYSSASIILTVASLQRPPASDTSLKSMRRALPYRLPLRDGCRGPAAMKPVFRPYAVAPRRGLRRGRSAAVHPAPPVRHCRPFARSAHSGERSTPRGGIGVARRVAVPQPAAARCMGCFAHFSSLPHGLSTPRSKQRRPLPPAHHPLRCYVDMLEHYRHGLLPALP